MYTSTILTKAIAFIIIVLSIDVTIMPSISADIEQVSADREFVEVTTELCGINGVKPHTVKLTQEEATELDNLLKDIQDRLNNSKSREETVAIFNDAIVSLNEFGLLVDLSVEEAQRLLVGGYQDSIGLLVKIFRQHQGALNNEENFDCFIAGRTKKTKFYPGYIIRFLTQLLKSIENYFDKYPIIASLFYGLILYPFVFLSPVGSLTISSIDQYITFGYESYGDTTPSSGWVWTQGSNGTKEWNGEFYGQLGLYHATFGGWRNDYIGATGFTGIKLVGLEESYSYFLGYASHVYLGPEHPFPP